MSSASSAPAAGTELPETNSMIVWPTIGATALGRWVGRLCGITAGLGRFATLGKLMALATIPVSLVAFGWQLMPWWCIRYRLTSRRWLVLRGVKRREMRAIALDAFDSVDIDVLPGQAWLKSGDLVFRQEGKEVFRLAGVGRPEVLRQICLDAQRTYTSVGKVLAAQALAALAAHTQAAQSAAAAANAGPATSG